MLIAQNKSQRDAFFTRRRHEGLHVYYISRSYFGLLRQSIRKNSDKIFVFKDTSRDVESMYRDIGGFGMKYDEFKEMRRISWSEKINSLCINRRKN